MHTRVIVILIALGFAGAARAELTVEDVMKLPPKKIESQLPKSHPSTYLTYAARLFKDGKKEDAEFWYYVGSIRYRFHLAANPRLDPSGDPALFGSLQSVIGQQINEYAGADPKVWVAQIERALVWDEANANDFTAKKKFKKELQEIRDGLGKMKMWIESHHDEIKAQRKKNGLEK